MCSFPFLMFAFLERIFLIFMAVSVARSVLQAVLRAFRGSQTPPDSAAGPTSAGQSPRTGTDANGGSASTLLHQDPVCGTYVAAASSLRKICNGKVFHFCSDECRNRYNG